MHYHPLTIDDQKIMLKEVGVSSFDELLKGVPSALRQPPIVLKEPLSEFEIQNYFKDIGNRNRTCGNTLSFLGGGSYEHFVPAAVASVLSRHEFYTAYTPYQAEASQGTLQTIYEFQSLVTELMALDVSNASHYDVSTSLAEAALLALRHTNRKKILISRSVHPHYCQVMETYLGGTLYSVEEVGFLDDGQLDENHLMSLLSDDVAGVILQSPNFLGIVENMDRVAESIHNVGALMILVTNPISLGVLKAPGEWGADIAVGDGQSLGMPLQFGGPYLGLFATTRALMRKIPGRLAGLTVDMDGKRAFCLTLQAREQHIRREKATSNICTAQALLAVMASMYAVYHGPQGL